MGVCHEMGKALLNLDLRESLSQGDFRWAAHDIQQIIDIDKNENGILTWKEISSQKAEAHQYLLNNLQISYANKKCSIEFSEQWQLGSHFDLDYAIIPFDLHCDGSDAISIQYSGLFSVDPGHSLLINVEFDEEPVQAIIAEYNQTITINSSKTTWASIGFLYQGVVHIFIGLDHLLFLACLLLAIIFPFNSSRQYLGIATAHPDETNDNKLILRKIIGVISIFTVAHSITLTLAAIGWINFPGKWIELGIAISVLAAVINTATRAIKRNYLMVFIFGLLHGLGFANALADLDSPLKEQLLNILAFNIGVELGQIVFTLIVAPVFFALNKIRSWRKQFYFVALGLSFIVASVWVIERLFSTIK